MATGLRQVVSPATDGSTIIVADRFLSTALSASGDGWSMALDTSVYTITLSNVSSILHADATIHASLANRDANKVIVTGKTATTVTLELYTDFYEAANTAAATLDANGAANVYISFMIVGTYAGK